MQLKTHQTGPEGQKVRRLYIEEGADIQKEYYVSLVTDRATQKVAFIASSEGGMDIEEVAHSTPEKIITEFIDPLTGLGDAQAKKIADSIGLPGTAPRRPSTSSRSSTPATWPPTPRWWRSTRSTATPRAT
jgi:succinyl-CoA synthetase beta subunit